MRLESDCICGSAPSRRVGQHPARRNRLVDGMQHVRIIRAIEAGRFPNARRVEGRLAGGIVHEQTRGLAQAT